MNCAGGTSIVADCAQRASGSSWPIAAILPSDLQAQHPCSQMGPRPSDSRLGTPSYRAQNAPSSNLSEKNSKLAENRHQPFNAFLVG